MNDEETRVTSRDAWKPAWLRQWEEQMKIGADSEAPPTDLENGSQGDQTVSQDAAMSARASDDVELSDASDTGDSCGWLEMDLADDADLYDYGPL